MTQSEEAALVAWSAMAAPADEAAGALVASIGAAEALEWVRWGARSLPAAAASLYGRCTREVAEAAVLAHERWERRLDVADEPHSRRATAIGARVVTRGAPGWPSALSSLGAAEPFALYVRGSADLDAAWSQGVAIVGARSSTAYGSHMAAELASGIAAAGRAVLSGGAYGIDAAAHRSALAAEAPTVAVMAGGVDRLYPAGNDALLQAVMNVGAIVSEVPPGFAPHRSRFLTRNRLIAAASATIVVEAALRSGALSTARHAAGLLRPIGAVPGPATSPSSAGCHALIRDGIAILVTRVDDVLELVDSSTEWAERNVGEVERLGERGREGVARPSFDSPADRAVYDVTSSRAITVERVAERAGLAWIDATTAAGRLEMQGLIERSKGGWKRAR
ncbi:DNA-processing protein DprA [Demequina lutea]|uniref:DNA processing protein n=1 Tax=Demequina lutea TaxID=431489 RepID=A0A7Z0CKL5_9MICO|nr:DNA-processing protein DprA [Demequina lutea]NYI41850.1 DNA processing protein [Demequina lutea]